LFYSRFEIQQGERRNNSIHKKRKKKPKIELTSISEKA